MQLTKLILYKMAENNPLGYIDFKWLRNSPNDECDGVCFKCPRVKTCAFMRAEKVSGNGYSSSQDGEFNSKMLDMFQFSPGRARGFSNPSRGPQLYASNETRNSQYTGGGAGYSRGHGYSGGLGEYFGELTNPKLGYGGGESSGGFHGSYSGKDSYAEMSPKFAKGYSFGMKRK